MKQKLYLFTLILLSQILSYGQTFTAGGINYLVTSATEPFTVAVGSHTNANGLINVNIPETVENNGTTYSVTSIRFYAFYECTTITSVTMGNSVTNIGESAFQGCTNLSSVTLSTSLTSLGEAVFRSCSALTTANIPSLLTEIPSDTFNNCTALTEVTIPNSVTNIGYYTFNNCTNLNSINIPNSLTSIGGYAFQNCTNITTINIPSTVTVINGNAFKNCTGLTSLKVNWTIPLQIFPDVFSGMTLANVALNVPTANVAAYQTAPVWQNFNIAIPPATHLNFDGDNDYVTLQNESSFDFTNQMTVEFWMNSNVTPQQWDALVVKGDESWRVALTDSGKLAFTGTGAFSDFFSTTTVTDGSWHHIAVSYNGSNAKIYIDGVEENSVSATGSLNNSDFAVSFGENLQQTGRFYKGNLDDVRIWNVARTMAQINQTKNCELQGIEIGLVAYYKFNQGTSGANNSAITSLNDGTINGNQGSFSGMALSGSTSNFIFGSVVSNGSTILSAPTASAQTFNLSGTVAALVPAPSATIVWYAVANGGSALTTETALSSGTYYVSEVNENGCQSERTSVEITVNLSVSAPTAISPQVYVGNGTIANLTANGTNLQWYTTATDVTSLDNTTLLIDGTTYYVSQTVGSIESDKIPVIVSRISDASQTFCGETTIADLISSPSTGTTAAWFAAESGGSELATNTTLGTNTYYLEQMMPTTSTNVGAGFAGASDAAVQADGKIIVVDYGNNAIKRMNADGTNIEILGSGFIFPTDVAIEADGKILVVDYGNSLIKRMNADGSGIVSLGFDFEEPVGIAVEADGKILVAEVTNNAIKRMNSSGTEITTVGSGFNMPRAVAVQADGKILVSDRGNNQIKRMDADGSNIVVLGSGFNSPAGVAEEANGKILIADFGNNSIKRMNANGTGISTIGSGYNSPSVIVEMDGKILVVNAGGSNSPIIRITEGNSSNRVAVSTTVNLLPNAPDTYNQDFCYVPTVAELSATGTGTIQWYDVAMDGEPLANSTYVTSGTYYVSQTVNDCESPRASVVVSLPAAPSVPTQNVCFNANVTDLAVSPNNNYVYRWYSVPTGGSPLDIYSTLSTGTYYVAEQSMFFEYCQSARASVQINVDEPFVGTIAYQTEISCNGANDGSASIVVSGGTQPYTYQWSSGHNTATLTGAGSGTYNLYVTDAKGCGVIPGIGTGTTVASLTFTNPEVLSVPTATTSIIYNQGETATALTATSGSIGLIWFETATGGAGFTAAPTPSTENAGNTSYWVASTNENGCESARVEISVQVNEVLQTPAPAITFSTQIFAGDDKTVADLQISGSNIIWYDAAIGGAVLPTTTVLIDETTYYASQTLEGIESENRVAITVNLISEPTQTLIAESTVADLVATPSAGSSIQWFASSTSEDALNNAETLSTGSYFVEQVNQNFSVATLTGTTQGFNDGDPSSAQFFQPYNLDFDADGNMYVADYINNRIRKVTPSGDVTTLAGAGPNGFEDGNGPDAFFNKPTDLVVDKVAQLIYVTDANNNAIRIVSFTGDVTTLTAGLGSGFADGDLNNAQFNYPSGIVRDLAGNLFISDQYNYRIRKITSAGNVSTLAGNGESSSVDGTGIGASLNGPAGIDFDSEGNLYVIEYDGFNLRKITTSGVVSTVVSGVEAGFLYPNGLAIDSQNNILIADTDNSLIKKVTPTGEVSVFAGSTFGYLDGQSANAQFKYPTGIAINNLGKIFIADTYNHKIRKITGVTSNTNRVEVAVIIENPLVLTPASQTNASCFGTATGSATVNVPTNGTAPFTYDWTGDPTGDGTTSISELLAGTYVCTVTDALGNTATQSFVITQPAEVVAPTAVGQAFDTNATVADLVPAPSEHILWYNVATNGTPLSTNTALTTSTYYLSSMNANGCESERVAIEVTVGSCVSPTLSSVTAAPACLGGDITVVLNGLLPNTAGIATYKVGNNPLQTQQGISNANGTFSFSAPATANLNGLVLQITKIVSNECETLFTDKNVTLVVVAPPTLSTVTAEPTCAGTKTLVVLSGMPPNTTGIATYKEGNGPLKTQSGTSDANGTFSFPTIALPAGANGLVIEITKLTTSAGCEATFIDKKVTLVVKPSPTLSTVTTQPVAAGNAGTIVLSGLLSNTTATATYKVNNGILETQTGTSTAMGTFSFSTPILNLTSNGAVIEITKITNENGCETSFKNKKVTLVVTDTNSTRKSDDNDSDKNVSESLHELDNTLSEIFIYPNPATDILNIKSALGIQSVEISNMFGQSVLFSNQKEINISHLPNGTYLVRIQDIRNNIEILKVLIK